MNQFERVAIFSFIETIEKQLQALKSLLVAAGNQSPAASHKVTQTLDHESHELSEDDEDRLQKELEITRNAEIERMRKHAESHFQSEWDHAAKAMSNLDG